MPELANSTNTEISLKKQPVLGLRFGEGEGEGREVEEAEREEGVEGEEGTGRGGSMGVGEQREQGKQAHMASFILRGGEQRTIAIMSIPHPSQSSPSK